MFSYFFILICFGFCSVRSNQISITKEQRQLSAESDLSHPCVRDCVAGESKVCNYTFIVDWHSSMNVQCGDCPYNLTACDNPGCIVGGGIVRPVVSANRRVPGPSILVCENDTIVVDLENAMDRETLTIHWHGIHQIGTTYMDGGPYITQCPLTPGDSFLYTFTASPHGTHMWHGHIGFQDSSGLFGALVVRRPEPSYISSLYDYDLPEHTFTVWHWYNESDREILPPILDTNSTMSGYGLLINGKASFRTFQSKTNSSEFISTPRAKFTVDQGMRYRFRVIMNSAIYCAIQLSIDNHTLLMFATGNDAFQPLTVESVMVNAGERFSFVVTADQEVGCYWMRMRGMGDCGPMMTSIHGEAYLCYTGATSEPDDDPTYDEGRRSGVLLNPVEVFKGENFTENQLVLLSDLTALEPESDTYSGTPNTTLYIQLDMPYYDEPDDPGPWPQFNNITFEFPSFSMLTQRSLLTSSSAGLCYDTPDPSYCLGTYCVCTITKEVPLNALVEIVLVDVSITRQQDHPLHLHGYKYHVVAMATVGKNVSVDYVKDLNEKGLISKKLVNATTVDTISVPNAGYAIIRFNASNPGFWLFHCHITNHLAQGMAMVLQVGDTDEMVEVPENFPTCGSGLYDPEAQQAATGTSQSSVQLSKAYFTYTCLVVLLLSGRYLM